MRWHVREQHTVYDSDWVRVSIADVELPDGRHLDHHILDMPRASVTAVVVDNDHNTLLLWRHRFITDSWGWEIPAGWANPDEDPAAAIAREIEEETGWRAGSIAPLTTYNALSGISTMRFTAYLATNPTHVGAPTDSSEATRVEWIPLHDIPALARHGQISDGPSLTALTYYLAVAASTEPT